MAKKKNPAAVELGRLGGQAKVPKGRMLHMSKEERSAAAKKTAEARWAGAGKPKKKKG